MQQHGKAVGRTAAVGGGSGHRKRRTAAGTAETTEPPRAGIVDETPYLTVGTICGRYPADEPQEEELTQTCSRTLWHHAPEMRTEHLTGYLASIARSKGYNWLRKNRPETMPIDDVVISDDTDVSAQAEQAELAGIVQEMLAQLPEQDRELLLRFYFYR